MDRKSLVAEVKSIVVASLGLPHEPDAIENDELLWAGRYHISSMAALEILTVLEERFHVQFPDEAIDLNLFTSIRRLADLVSNLLSDEANIDIKPSDL